MKIMQNILLNENNQISTWLSGSGPLNEAIELSFHPYALRVIAKPKALEKAFINPLLIKWQIKLVDDEQREPLLNLASENRSLLLFSEMFNSLFECCEQIGFNIDLIKPNKNLNTLDLELSIKASFEQVVNAALILRIALDSLLFCRGIIISESSLALPSKLEQSEVLHAIFTSDY